MRDKSTRLECKWYTIGKKKENKRKKKNYEGKNVMSHGLRSK